MSLLDKHFLIEEKVNEESNYIYALSALDAGQPGSEYIRILSECSLCGLLLLQDSEVFIEADNDETVDNSD